MSKREASRTVRLPIVDIKSFAQRRFAHAAQEAVAVVLLPLNTKNALLRIDLGEAVRAAAIRGGKRVRDSIEALDLLLSRELDKATT